MRPAVEILLGGDVNLMGMTPDSAPFAALRASFQSADFTFVNLECCLYDGDEVEDGYFAAPHLAGQALKQSGIGGVGLANNVNYGVPAIMSSLGTLAALQIPVTGAGCNSRGARAPLIVERAGYRIGIVQRTAIYWPQAHEALPDKAGVAAIAAHTDYLPPVGAQRRPGLPPSNRPGLPPVIETRADPAGLKIFVDELHGLRQQVDVVVASFHWGLFDEVLGYMKDYAHAAIDAGADLVVGHGPHDHLLPIEMRGGRPIFYNLGALSFRHGPGGKTFHDWLGLLVRFEYDGASRRASFRLVRQCEDMSIRLVSPDEESQALAIIAAASNGLGTQLEVSGMDVVVQAAG
ncbi:CapA family protein [Bordetella sp. BOR01]|uniref:CapA family protein n=1 Tax=Bordetella sp. BOR01 TaxID=2854779 RepID=UPI001C47E733|nr:CapA family protein [Bordetella sp. BOR01]MBV7482764.1 CapA family protein [Bordetella sp. BOR01]